VGIGCARRHYRSANQGGGGHRFAPLHVLTARPGIKAPQDLKN
jgi:hypothetical protein